MVFIYKWKNHMTSQFLGMGKLKARCTLLASIGNPAKESTAVSPIPQQAVCDTGERLPPKVVRFLREMSLCSSIGSCQLHCCNPLFSQKTVLTATVSVHLIPPLSAARKTIDNIFTWLLGVLTDPYQRYVPYTRLCYHK